jgi:hypothetical protein
MDIDKATATQLANIEKRMGKSLSELTRIIKKSGLSRHGELVALLKKDLGMGHGDANTLVHYARGSDAAVSPAADPLEMIYAGPKAHLGAIHNALMTAIERFGPFEIAPKKGYVSLRGKKQFAMIGPATNSQIEIGLNMKGVKGTARLIEQKPGGMCQYKVRVSGENEVNQELLDWLRRAYDGSI